MTSLRVALKLSMAASQGTPSAAAVATNTSTSSSSSMPSNGSAIKPVTISRINTSDKIINSNAITNSDANKKNSSNSSSILSSPFPLPKLNPAQSPAPTLFKVADFEPYTPCGENGENSSNTKFQNSDLKDMRKPSTPLISKSSQKPKKDSTSVSGKKRKLTTSDSNNNAGNGYPDNKNVDRHDDDVAVSSSENAASENDSLTDQQSVQEPNILLVESNRKQITANHTTDSLDPKEIDDIIRTGCLKELYAKMESKDDPCADNISSGTSLEVPFQKKVLSFGADVKADITDETAHESKIEALVNPVPLGEEVVGLKEVKSNETIRPVKKLKRKRTPSILKALDPIHVVAEGQSASLDSGSEDDSLSAAQRFQSHRAAAKVARTKLNSRSKSVDEDDDDKQSGKLSVAAVDAADVGVSSQQQSRWVQCDRCKKWRSIAPAVQDGELPDEWYCRLNSWNDKYNHCDAPEEVFKESGNQKGATNRSVHSQQNRRRTNGDDVNNTNTEADKEIRGFMNHSGREREGGRGGGRGFRGRWSKKRRQASRNGGASSTGNGEGGEEGGLKNRGDESASEDGDVDRLRADDGTPLHTNQSNANVGANYTNRKKPTVQRISNFQPHQHQAPQSEGADGVANSVNWVQCNKCEKWRKVPIFINVNFLPEVWYCSFNTWVAPSMARCSVRQEEDDSVMNYDGTGMTDASLATSRPRRNIGNTTSSHGSKTIEAKNIQWVQCEQRNCKKWRKVPAYIDVEALPELWYCTMNTWDLEKANCAAIADDDDKNSNSQQTEYGSSHNAGSNKKPGSVGNHLISSNSKGPGSLSYRRIIFGNDGRLRAFFSEKNKNGFGLFSFPESVPSNNTIGKRLLELQQQDSTSLTTPDTDEMSVDSNGFILNPVAVAAKNIIADYPTRRVSYWWSSLYDECAATYSAATPSVGRNGEANPTHRSASLVPSSSEIEKENVSLPSTTFLLDAVRKIHGMGVSPCDQRVASVPNSSSTRLPIPLHQLRKTPRSWQTVYEMSILERDCAECSAVRSCFLLTPSMTLTLPLLISLLAAVKFTQDDVDAVREQLVLDKSLVRLRNVLRRLEERGEAEVSYTSSGVLSIQMHQSMDSDYSQIHSTLSSGAICNPNNSDTGDFTSNIAAKGMKRYSYRNGVVSSPDKVKKILPLKMRKFFDAKGMLKSERTTSSVMHNSTKNNPPAAASVNRRGSKTFVSSIDATTASGKTQNRPAVAGTNASISSKAVTAIRKENHESLRMDQNASTLSKTADNFPPITAQLESTTNAFIINEATKILPNLVDRKIPEITSNGDSLGSSKLTNIHIKENDSVDVSETIEKDSSSDYEDSIEPILEKMEDSAEVKTIHKKDSAVQQGIFVDAMNFTGSLSDDVLEGVEQLTFAKMEGKDKSEVNTTPNEIREDRSASSND